MLAVLVCSLLMRTPIVGRRVPSSISTHQDAERLRTVLPNGAVIFAEHVPRADRLIVQLFVGNRNVATDTLTNGRRHLLEHLSALGRNRDLDTKLESQGAFLTAETLRDATVYQISLRPDDLNLAGEAIRSLFQLGDISTDDIKKEAEVIRQEVALESTYHALSRVAWAAAYGNEGGDPLGDPDTIAATPPQALSELHAQEFVGSNLTLVISGPQGLDFMTSAAKELMGPLPPKTLDMPSMRKFLGGGTSSVDREGEAVACEVPEWGSPRTSARLAAAFSIASSCDNSFVTYTPSLQGSLIVVGRTGETSGLDQVIAGLSARNEFEIGRDLAKAWVKRQESVQANNTLTGLLISEGFGQKPEEVLENLDQMTLAQFAAALELFKSKDVVKVIGR
jgi:predicted Zn-dependent peptidase